MLWSSHDAIAQLNVKSNHQLWVVCIIAVPHTVQSIFKSSTMRRKKYLTLTRENVTQKRLFLLNVISHIQPMKWLPSPLSFFHWTFIGSHVWVPVPFWGLSIFPAHPVSSNLVSQLTKLLWSQNLRQYVSNLATCHDVHDHHIAVQYKLSQFACRQLIIPRLVLNASFTIWYHNRRPVVIKVNHGLRWSDR